VSLDALTGEKCRSREDAAKLCKVPVFWCSARIYRNAELGALLVSSIKTPLAVTLGFRTYTGCSKWSCSESDRL